MDSKHKTLRTTKSLSQQRGSVRRKQSFNKVLLQFESVSKSSVESNISVIRGTPPSVSPKKSKTNVTSNLEVIRERDDIQWRRSGHQNNAMPKKSNQLLSIGISDSPIDSTRPRSLSDLSSIKSKISFFESQRRDSIPEAKTETRHHLANYGNTDTKQLNDSCDERELKSESESMSPTIDSIESNDGLSNDFEDSIECISNKYFRSTSQSSDVVSFDTGIVFRNPFFNKELKQTHREVPVPKPRTRVNVIKECKPIIESEDSLKILETKDTHKVDIARSSSNSEDSGISDLFQTFISRNFENNSFLHQTNKPNDTCVENSCQRDHELDNEFKQIQNYGQTDDENIYDEIMNLNESVVNEWVDIEDKKNIQIQVIVNRKPQNIRQSCSAYRKSLKPKHIKRKSFKRVVEEVVSDGSGEYDGNATEYEDMDDDEDIQSTHSSQTESVPLSQCQSMPPVVLRSERLEIPIGHNSHIYEDIPPKYLQSDDLTRKLVRELSNRLARSDTSRSGDKHTTESADVRTENNSNIYTSTPRRLPSIHETIPDVVDAIGRLGVGGEEFGNRRKESIVSRNSSIYISPEYTPTNYMNKVWDQQNIINSEAIRRELMQKQNSNTNSIASYLEFNTCADNSSPFNSEPLYQFYQKDVCRRAELWIHLDQKTTDLEYEELENKSIYGSGDLQVNLRVGCSRGHTQTDSHVNERIKNIVSNKSILDFVGNGPIRSLWCHLPQVINSKDSLLSTLSDKEKRLQETMFEIITSEASYCKSLNILLTLFNNCNEFNVNNTQILSQREKKCLFSNIVDIARVSSDLLSDLRKRFEQSILLYDICDILCDYAINHFQPYIHYCAYQRDQEKLLRQLTQTRPQFVDVVQRLESNQICQNQTLLSFLMLPMQRITRYPLLIDAVCQQLPESSQVLDSSRKALGIVNQLVRKCNEETKIVQRMQELIEIEKVLHFRSKMKSYPIVSGARYLVKKGSVVKLCPQLSAKRTIGKSTIKWTKSSMYLFLFSDVLILAKKKSETNYSVFDYCSRNTVQLISLSNSGEGIGTVGAFKKDIPRNHINLAQLILLHNHESKSAEYVISFNLESDKLRWMEAVSQPSSQNPNEVIYEEWDCPQVQCIRSYCAQQTDEISLEETDVLDVYRKMGDGWFEGQRIRDGIKGWFPSEFTEEIVNQHVRARNIKLRHRLLMYTQSVIDVQKRASIDLHKYK